MRVLPGAMGLSSCTQLCFALSTPRVDVATIGTVEHKASKDSAFRLYTFGRRITPSIFTHITPILGYSYRDDSVPRNRQSNTECRLSDGEQLRRRTRRAS